MLIRKFINYIKEKILVEKGIIRYRQWLIDNQAILGVYFLKITSAIYGVIFSMTYTIFKWVQSDQYVHCLLEGIYRLASLTVIFLCKAFRLVFKPLRATKRIVLMFFKVFVFPISIPLILVESLTQDVKFQIIFSKIMRITRINANLLLLSILLLSARPLRICIRVIGLVITFFQAIFLLIRNDLYVLIYNMYEFIIQGIPELFKRKILYVCFISFISYSDSAVLVLSRFFDGFTFEIYPYREVLLTLCLILLITELLGLYVRAISSKKIFYSTYYLVIGFSLMSVLFFNEYVVIKVLVVYFNVWIPALMYNFRFLREDDRGYYFKNERFHGFVTNSISVISGIRKNVYHSSFVEIIYFLLLIASLYTWLLDFREVFWLFEVNAILSKQLPASSTTLIVIFFVLRQSTYAFFTWFYCILYNFIYTIVGSLVFIKAAISYFGVLFDASLNQEGMLGAVGLLSSLFGIEAYVFGTDYGVFSYYYGETFASRLYSALSFEEVFDISQFGLNPFRIGGDIYVPPHLYNPGDDHNWIIRQTIEEMYFNAVKGKLTVSDKLGGDTQKYWPIERYAYRVFGEFLENDLYYGWSNRVLIDITNYNNNSPYGKSNMFGDNFMSKLTVDIFSIFSGQNELSSTLGNTMHEWGEQVHPGSTNNMLRGGLLHDDNWAKADIVQRTSVNSEMYWEWFPGLYVLDGKLESKLASSMLIIILILALPVPIFLWLAFTGRPSLGVLDNFSENDAARSNFFFFGTQQMETYSSYYWSETYKVNYEWPVLDHIFDTNELDYSRDLTDTATKILFPPTNQVSILDSLMGVPILKEGEIGSSLSYKKMLMPLLFPMEKDLRGANAAYKVNREYSTLLTDLAADIDSGGLLFRNDTNWGAEDSNLDGWATVSESKSRPGFIDKELEDYPESQSVEDTIVDEPNTEEMLEISDMYMYIDEALDFTSQFSWEDVWEQDSVNDQSTYFIQGYPATSPKGIFYRNKLLKYTGAVNRFIQPKLAKLRYKIRFQIALWKYKKFRILVLETDTILARRKWLAGNQQFLAEAPSMMKDPEFFNHRLYSINKSIKEGKAEYSKNAAEYAWKNRHRILISNRYSNAIADSYKRWLNDLLKSDRIVGNSDTKSSNLWKFHKKKKLNVLSNFNVLHSPVKHTRYDKRQYRAFFTKDYLDPVARLDYHTVFSVPLQVSTRRIEITKSFMDKNPCYIPNWFVKLGIKHLETDYYRLKGQISKNHNWDSWEHIVISNSKIGGFYEISSVKGLKDPIRDLIEFEIKKHISDKFLLRYALDSLGSDNAKSNTTKQIKPYTINFYSPNCLTISSYTRIRWFRGLVSGLKIVGGKNINFKKPNSQKKLDSLDPITLFSINYSKNSWNTYNVMSKSYRKYRYRGYIRAVRRSFLLTALPFWIKFKFFGFWSSRKGESRFAKSFTTPEFSHIPWGPLIDYCEGLIPWAKKNLYGELLKSYGYNTIRKKYRRITISFISCFTEYLVVSSSLISSIRSINNLTDQNKAISSLIGKLRVYKSFARSIHNFFYKSRNIQDFMFFASMEYRIADELCNYNLMKAWKIEYFIFHVDVMGTLRLKCVPSVFFAGLEQSVWNWFVREVMSDGLWGAVSAYRQLYGMGEAMCAYDAIREKSVGLNRLILSAFKETLNLKFTKNVPGTNLIHRVEALQRTYGSLNYVKNKLKKNKFNLKYLKEFNYTNSKAYSFSRYELWCREELRQKQRIALYYIGNTFINGGGNRFQVSFGSYPFEIWLLNYIYSGNSFTDKFMKTESLTSKSTITKYLYEKGWDLDEHALAKIYNDIYNVARGLKVSRFRLITLCPKVYKNKANFCLYSKVFHNLTKIRPLGGWESTNYEESLCFLGLQTRFEDYIRKSNLQNITLNSISNLNTKSDMLCGWKMYFNYTRRVGLPLRTLNILEPAYSSSAVWHIPSSYVLKTWLKSNSKGVSLMHIHARWLSYKKSKLFLSKAILGVNLQGSKLLCELEKLVELFSVISGLQPRPRIRLTGLFENTLHVVGVSRTSMREQKLLSIRYTKVLVYVLARTRFQHAYIELLRKKLKIKDIHDNVGGVREFLIKEIGFSIPWHRSNISLFVASELRFNYKNGKIHYSSGLPDIFRVMNVNIHDNNLSLSNIFKTISKYENLSKIFTTYWKKSTESHGLSSKFKDRVYDVSFKNKFIARSKVTRGYWDWENPISVKSKPTRFLQLPYTLKYSYNNSNFFYNNIGAMRFWEPKSISNLNAVHTIFGLDYLFTGDSMVDSTYQFNNEYLPFNDKRWGRLSNRRKAMRKFSRDNNGFTYSEVNPYVKPRGLLKSERLHSKILNNDFSNYNSRSYSVWQFRLFYKGFGWKNRPPKRKKIILTPPGGNPDEEIKPKPVYSPYIMFLRRKWGQRLYLNPGSGTDEDGQYDTDLFYESYADFHGHEPKEFLTRPVPRRRIVIKKDQAGRLHLNNIWTPTVLNLASLGEKHNYNIKTKPHEVIEIKPKKKQKKKKPKVLCKRIRYKNLDKGFYPKDLAIIQDWLPTPRATRLKVDWHQIYTKKDGIRGYFDPEYVRRGQITENVKKMYGTFDYPKDLEQISTGKNPYRISSQLRANSCITNKRLETTHGGLKQKSVLGYSLKSFKLQLWEYLNEPRIFELINNPELVGKVPDIKSKSPQFNREYTVKKLTHLLTKDKHKFNWYFVQTRERNINRVKVLEQLAQIAKHNDLMRKSFIHKKSNKYIKQYGSITRLFIRLRHLKQIGLERKHIKLIKKKNASIQLSFLDRVVRKTGYRYASVFIKKYTPFLLKGLIGKRLVSKKPNTKKQYVGEKDTSVVIRFPMNHAGNWYKLFADLKMKYIVDKEHVVLLELITRVLLTIKSLFIKKPRINNLTKKQIIKTLSKRSENDLLYIKRSVGLKQWALVRLFVKVTHKPESGMNRYFKTIHGGNFSATRSLGLGNNSITIPTAISSTSKVYGSIIIGGIRRSYAAKKSKLLASSFRGSRVYSHSVIKTDVLEDLHQNGFLFFIVLCLNHLSVKGYWINQTPHPFSLNLTGGQPQIVIKKISKRAHTGEVARLNHVLYKTRRAVPFYPPVKNKIANVQYRLCLKNYIDNYDELSMYRMYRSRSKIVILTETSTEVEFPLNTSKRKNLLHNYPSKYNFIFDRYMYLQYEDNILYLWFAKNSKKIKTKERKWYTKNKPMSLLLRYRQEKSHFNIINIGAMSDQLNVTKFLFNYVNFGRENTPWVRLNTRYKGYTFYRKPRRLIYPLSIFWRYFVSRKLFFKKRNCGLMTIMAQFIRNTRQLATERQYKICHGGFITKTIFLKYNFNASSVSRFSDKVNLLFKKSRNLKKLVLYLRKNISNIDILRYRVIDFIWLKIAHLLMSKKSKNLLYIIFEWILLVIKTLLSYGQIARAADSYQTILAISLWRNCRLASKSIIKTNFPKIRDNFISISKIKKYHNLAPSWHRTEIRQFINKQRTERASGRVLSPEQYADDLNSFDRVLLRTPDSQDKYIKPSIRRIFLKDSFTLEVLDRIPTDMKIFYRPQRKVKKHNRIMLWSDYPWMQRYYRKITRKHHVKNSVTSLKWKYAERSRNKSKRKYKHKAHLLKKEIELDRRLKSKDNPLTSWEIAALSTKELKRIIDKKNRKMRNRRLVSKLPKRYPKGMSQITKRVRYIRKYRNPYSVSSILNKLGRMFIHGVLRQSDYDSSIIKGNKKVPTLIYHLESIKKWQRVLKIRKEVHPFYYWFLKPGEDTLIDFGEHHYTKMIHARYDDINNVEEFKKYRTYHRYVKSVRGIRKVWNDLKWILLDRYMIRYTQRHLRSWKPYESYRRLDANHDWFQRKMTHEAKTIAYDIKKIIRGVNHIDFNLVSRTRLRLNKNLQYQNAFLHLSYIPMKEVKPTYFTNYWDELMEPHSMARIWNIGKKRNYDWQAQKLADKQKDIEEHAPDRGISLVDVDWMDYFRGTYRSDTSSDHDDKKLLAASNSISQNFDNTNPGFDSLWSDWNSARVYRKHRRLFYNGSPQTKWKRNQTPEWLRRTWDQTYHRLPIDNKRLMNDIVAKLPFYVSGNWEGTTSEATVRGNLDEEFYTPVSQNETRGFSRLGYIKFLKMGRVSNNGVWAVPGFKKGLNVYVSDIDDGFYDDKIISITNPILWVVEIYRHLILSRWRIQKEYAKNNSNASGSYSSALMHDIAYYKYKVFKKFIRNTINFDKSSIFLHSEEQLKTIQLNDAAQQLIPAKNRTFEQYIWARKYFRVLKRIIMKLGKTFVNILIRYRATIFFGTRLRGYENFRTFRNIRYVYRVQKYAGGIIYRTAIGVHSQGGDYEKTEPIGKDLRYKNPFKKKKWRRTWALSNFENYNRSTTGIFGAIRPDYLESVEIKKSLPFLKYLEKPKYLIKKIDYEEPWRNLIHFGFPYATASGVDSLNTSERMDSNLRMYRDWFFSNYAVNDKFLLMSKTGYLYKTNRQPLRTNRVRRWKWGSNLRLNMNSELWWTKWVMPNTTERRLDGLVDEGFGLLEPWGFFSFLHKGLDEIAHNNTFREIKIESKPFFERSLIDPESPAFNEDGVFPEFDENLVFWSDYRAHFKKNNDDIPTDLEDFYVWSDINLIKKNIFKNTALGMGSLAQINSTSLNDHNPIDFGDIVDTLGVKDIDPLGLAAQGIAIDLIDSNLNDILSYTISTGSNTNLFEPYNSKISVKNTPIDWDSLDLLSSIIFSPKHSSSSVINYDLLLNDISSNFWSTIVESDSNFTTLYFSGFPQISDKVNNDSEYLPIWNYDPSLFDLNGIGDYTLPTIPSDDSKIKTLEILQPHNSERKHLASKGLTDQRLLVGEMSLGGANIVEGLHEDIPYDALYGSENDTDADKNIEIFDLNLTEDRRDSNFMGTIATHYTSSSEVHITEQDYTKINAEYPNYSFAHEPRWSEPVIHPIRSYDFRFPIYHLTASEKEDTYVSDNQALNNRFMDKVFWKNNIIRNRRVGSVNVYRNRWKRGLKNQRNSHVHWRPLSDAEYRDSDLEHRPRSFEIGMDRDVYVSSEIGKLPRKGRWEHLGEMRYGALSNVLPPMRTIEQQDPNDFDSALDDSFPVTKGLDSISMFDAFAFKNSDENLRGLTISSLRNEFLYVSDDYSDVDHKLHLDNDIRVELHSFLDWADDSILDEIKSSLRDDGMDDTHEIQNYNSTDSYYNEFIENDYANQLLRFPEEVVDITQSDLYTFIYDNYELSDLPNSENQSELYSINSKDSIDDYVINDQDFLGYIDNTTHYSGDDSGSLSSRRSGSLDEGDSDIAWFNFKNIANQYLIPLNTVQPGVNPEYNIFSINHAKAGYTKIGFEDYKEKALIEADDMHNYWLNEWVDDSSKVSDNTSRESITFSHHNRYVQTFYFKTFLDKLLVSAYFARNRGTRSEQISTFLSMGRVVEPISLIGILMERTNYLLKYRRLMSDIGLEHLSY